MVSKSKLLERDNFEVCSFKHCACYKYLLNGRRNNNCDWICENNSLMGHYKYFEICIWTVQCNLTREGRKLHTQHFLLICSCLRYFSGPTLTWIAGCIACNFRYGTAQFKLDIYTCVTLELPDKFVWLLASFTWVHDPIS